MESMGPMARALERLRTKKLLKGKYYSKRYAGLKQFAPEYPYFMFVRVHEMLKFIYSEKATKFCEIFTLLLTKSTYSRK